MSDSFEQSVSDILSVPAVPKAALLFACSMGISIALLVSMANNMDTTTLDNADVSLLQAPAKETPPQPAADPYIARLSL